MVEIPGSFELMFEKIFKNLFASKQFFSVDTDAAIFEYSNFVSIKVKENKDPFIKFDKETDLIYVFIWKLFTDIKTFSSKSPNRKFNFTDVSTSICEVTTYRLMNCTSPGSY